MLPALLFDQFHQAFPSKNNEWCEIQKNGMVCDSDESSLVSVNYVLVLI